MDNYIMYENGNDYITTYDGFTIYDGLTFGGFLFIAATAILFLVIAIVPIRKFFGTHTSKSQMALIKCVDETSSVLSELRKINSKYKFHNDIEDCYTITYSGFKSRAAFDKASIQQYAIRVVGGNCNFYISAIEKAKQNKELYGEYQQEISPLKEQITEENWSDLSRFKKKRAYQYELHLFNELELHPVTFTSLYIKKIYSSPQGRNWYYDQQHFRPDQILDLISYYERQQKAEYERKQTIQYQRSALTPSLRYDILKRDKFRCVLCGASADDGASLEVDHIIPVTKGGKTEMSNLRTLCHACNAGKSDKYTPDGLN